MQKVFSLLLLLVLIFALNVAGCGSSAGNGCPAPLSSEKAITAFTFADPPVVATINESAKTIAITVPYGTDPRALVASFTTTGSCVKVGSTPQVSGTTPNDFSNSVLYIVSAEDGTTALYTVTVTVAPSSAKAITSFSFTSPPAAGVINESTKSISVTVPYGTSVTNLVATFATTGTRVEVNSVLQVCGVTPNDFTNPVNYTVKAADGSMAKYTVTIRRSSCSSDDITGIPASGSITLATSNDFAPLCSGTVLVGDNALNMIREVNVITGPSATYQLTSTPGDLELDKQNNLLYASQAPATVVSVIDLNMKTQKQITVGSGAIHLASGSNGNMFATLGPSGWTYPVALLNGLTATVEKVFPTQIEGALIAFDRSHNQLISGAWGSSPSSLSRYQFDPINLSLTLTESLWDAGSNGEDIAVSPDGNHVAFTNGGGNGYGYTIYDFSTTGFGTIYGEWSTGAYPSAADFDPSGQYLIASNGWTVQIFSVATHVKLKEYPLNLDYSSCSYASLKKVHFSLAGKIAYALVNCGYPPNDYARLFWFLLRRMLVLDPGMQDA